MSHQLRMARPPMVSSAFAVISCLFAALACPVAATATDERPEKRAAPPGILVEPRPQPKERDSGETPPDREQGDNRPGCPANERPLELLV